MGVDPELLEILACPKCKTPVVLVHEETGLKCKQCHRVYPIKDDIPVMLIDEERALRVTLYPVGEPRRPPAQCSPLPQDT